MSNIKLFILFTLVGALFAAAGRCWDWRGGVGVRRGRGLRAIVGEVVSQPLLYSIVVLRCMRQLESSPSLPLHAPVPCDSPARPRHPGKDAHRISRPAGRLWVRSPVAPSSMTMTMAGG